MHMHLVSPSVPAAQNGATSAAAAPRMCQAHHSAVVVAAPRQLQEVLHRLGSVLLVQLRAAQGVGRAQGSAGNAGEPCQTAFAGRAALQAAWQRGTARRTRCTASKMLRYLNQHGRNRARCPVLMQSQSTKCNPKPQNAKQPSGRTSTWNVPIDVLISTRGASMAVPLIYGCCCADG